MALPKKIKSAPESNRFRTILFGKPGMGKTHFATSFPNAFYINTESVKKYQHFRDRVENKDGHIENCTDLYQVIGYVKDLINEKHDYATLVIDSLSQPLLTLAIMEADRLKKESKKKIEGTEFGSDKKKGVALTVQLGLLIDRLDMNVIILAHEVGEYEGDIEIAKTHDCSPKLEYSVPTSFRMIGLSGSESNVFVRKSTYPEFRRGEIFSYNTKDIEPYDYIKSRFNGSIFEKSSSQPEPLASEEQIIILNGLIETLQYDSEKIQAWYRREKAMDFTQFRASTMKKCIDYLMSLKKESNV